MPTPSQIAEKLFKKSLGKGDTDQGKPFFEEDPSIDGYTHILPEQIWNQGGDIPAVSPFGIPNSTTMSIYDGSTSGVVQYIHNLQLQNNPAMGDKSYFHEDLRDSIAFNFGNGGTYNYSITTQGGDPIAFGIGDWVVDNDQGLITFYDTLPSGVSQSTPPRISFYRYIGAKGLVDVVDASGTTWSTFQLDNDASGVKIKNNNGNLEVRNYLDNDYTNLKANHIDVSTLKIDNLTGYLYADDGSISAIPVNNLLSHEETINGDASISTFYINHGFNSKYHSISVYDASTDEEIYPDKERGTNEDVISFYSPPQIGENYNIVCLGF